MPCRQGKEDAITRARDGRETRRHVSVRVREATAESFDVARSSRGYSRPAALEEAMSQWATGRAEEAGLRSAGVAERLDTLAELVTGEGESSRELAKAHRNQLGGLIATDLRYAVEMVYALIEAVFPRAAEVSREQTRAAAHQHIQAGRRSRDAGETKDGQP